MDPPLHADPASGRSRLREAVVDIGIKRLERYGAKKFELAARHFATAQAAANHNLHALRTGAHGSFGRHLDGPPEGNPAFQLIGNVTNNEKRVEFGLADLFDINHYTLAGVLFDPILDFLTVTTASPDHNARTRRMDHHSNLADLALDLDLRYPGPVAAPPAASAASRIASVGRFEVATDQIADCQILQQQFRVVAIGVPRTFPTRGVAQTVADGMNFCDPCLRHSVFHGHGNVTGALDIHPNSTT